MDCAAGQKTGSERGMCHLRAVEERRDKRAGVRGYGGLEGVREYEREYERAVEHVHAGRAILPAISECQGVRVNKQGKSGLYRKSLWSADPIGAVQQGLFWIGALSLRVVPLFPTVFSFSYGVSSWFYSY